MITFGLVIKCLLILTGSIVLICMALVSLLIFVDHQVDDLIDEEKKDQEP